MRGTYITHYQVPDNAGVRRECDGTAGWAVLSPSGPALRSDTREYSIYTLN